MSTTFIDQLINAESLGSMLALSKRQVFRLQSQGRIPPHIKVGGAVRWKRSEVLQWIEWDCCSLAEFNERIQALKNGCSLQIQKSVAVHE